jgi:hypothetical protein
MAKAKSEVTQIIVRRVNRARIEVTIESEPDVPLIVHNFSTKAQIEMKGIFQGKKKMKEIRTEAWDESAFENAKYKTRDGRDGFPANALAACIRSAARYVPSLTLTEARGLIFVPGHILPLKFEECEPYEAQVRNSNGSPDLRVRPRYWGWSITFQIEYNADLIAPESLLNLVELAGFHCGLGEWRPNSKLSNSGWAGRFHIARSDAKKAVA